MLGKTFGNGKIWFKKAMLRKKFQHSACVYTHRVASRIVRVLVCMKPSKCRCPLNQIEENLEIKNFSFIFIEFLIKKFIEWLEILKFHLKKWQSLLKLFEIRNLRNFWKNLWISNWKWILPWKLMISLKNLRNSHWNWRNPSKFEFSWKMNWIWIWQDILDELRYN